MKVIDGTIYDVQYPDFNQMSQEEIDVWSKGFFEELVPLVCLPETYSDYTQVNPNIQICPTQKRSV